MCSTATQHSTTSPPSPPPLYKTYCQRHHHHHHLTSYRKLQRVQSVQQQQQLTGTFGLRTSARRWHLHIGAPSRRKSPRHLYVRTHKAHTYIHTALNTHNSHHAHYLNGAPHSENLSRARVKFSAHVIWLHERQLWFLVPLATPQTPNPTTSFKRVRTVAKIICRKLVLFGKTATAIIRNIYCKELHTKPY